MSFKMPHNLVLMFGLMITALIITWVVPSGSFQMTQNEYGHNVVIPGTYTEVETKERLSPVSLLTVVPRALADAQGIIFFVLIIGGSISVIRKTGAIDAFLGWLLKQFGDRPKWLLFSMMFVFAMGSATIGIAEEYIPFAIILVSLCVALRLDAITAIGTLVAGYGIGYGIAFMNPFTLVLAQNVAGLPPLSGWEFRIILVIPFLMVGFHHVWSYAKKVLNDPKASYMYGIDSSIATQTKADEYPELNARRKLILLVTVLTLALLVFGISQYGWYLVELSALFLALAIVIGLMSGFGVNTTASEFTKGAAELTGTALLIGFARSIALLMEDGQVLHTVVQALASPLAIFGAELAAVGMLIIQSGLNFFIPSGSGQAFVSMPLMGPIGDLVGVSRQVSVLAFQFGDGLMNMIVPTNPVLMGILGLAGIPYAKWLKFIVPLILKLLALATVAMVIAVQIGFS